MKGDKMLFRVFLEGFGLAMFIVLSQLYILPQFGLFTPSVEGVAGMAFGAFLVYISTMTIVRSEKNEES
jgi:hypothetical protein